MNRATLWPRTVEHETNQLLSAIQNNKILLYINKIVTLQAFLPGELLRDHPVFLVESKLQMPTNLFGHKARFSFDFTHLKRERKLL